MDSYAKYEKCRGEMYKRYREYVEKAEDAKFEMRTQYEACADGIMKAIQILDKYYA